jgi:hydrogenase expression/formation protein HypC
MCLAIPARITAIDPTGQTATVALGAVRKDISLALLDDAVVGDYVLVHVGYALNRISEEEAELTLAVMRDAGILEEEGEEVQDGTPQPSDAPGGAA